MAAALCLVATALTAGSGGAYLVWPPPKSFTATGPPRQLAAAFTSTVVDWGHDLPAQQAQREESAARLSRGLRRFDRALARLTLGRGASPSSTLPLDGVDIHVQSSSTHLGIATKYNYSVEVTGGGSRGRIVASSIYGALYALETLLQLVDTETGLLLHSDVMVADAPDYSWRGLMVDSGRRFFPVPLLQNLIGG